MNIDGQFLAFNFDEEKLFLRMDKPTWEDMDYLDIYEITSPHDADLLSTIKSRRSKKKIIHEDVPLSEWRRRLALLPDYIISRTMDCTTQFDLNA